MSLLLNVEGFHTFRWNFLPTDAQERSTSFRPLVTGCLPAEALDTPAPAPTQRGQKRRPVVLIQAANSLSQLAGPTQLLLAAAGDPVLKGSVPDFAFCDLLLELEFIEYRLDAAVLGTLGAGGGTALDRTESGSLARQQQACPVLARKEGFTDQFGEPFADDWKVLLDDMDRFPGGE